MIASVCGNIESQFKIVYLCKTDTHLSVSSARFLVSGANFMFRGIMILVHKE